MNPQDTNRRPLLNVNRAAQLLGVSRRTLERMTAIGLLPVVRVGSRAIRLAPSDIEEFIDSRRTVRRNAEI